MCATPSIPTRPKSVLRLVSLRLNTLFGFCLARLNALMVTSTGALALVLWTQGKVECRDVAMALPLAWQNRQHRRLGGLAIHRSSRQVGRYPEGHDTIAGRSPSPNCPMRPTLKGRAADQFRMLRFGYGRESGVIDGLTPWTRPPGARRSLRPFRAASRRWSICCCAFFFDTSEGRPHRDRTSMTSPRHARELRVKSPWSRMTTRCCTARVPAQPSSTASRRPPDSES